MHARLLTSAALAIVFGLCVSTSASAHGTSNLEAAFDVLAAGAPAGQRVTLEVVLQELAPNAADGAVVDAAVFTADDVQRFTLERGEALRFRGSFELKDGSHDLRVYVVRGDVREVAMSGFQVNGTLTPIPAASRVLFFNAAGKRDAIPALDNLSGIVGGLAALIAILVLLRRPRREPDAAALKPRWMLAVAAAAAVMTPFGGYWDIAFHMSRGREGLLSPPHVLIYGGILASMLVIGVALLHKPRDVSYPTHWRRNPIAFAAGVAMAIQLSSAPFDELWHTIFGLDVSVWSPPHAVLIFGGVAVFLILASLPVMNAASAYVTAARLFALGAALLAIDLFLAESVFPFPEWHVSQHRPAFVSPLLEVLGAVLVAVVARRALTQRWAATGAIIAFFVLRLAVYPLLSALDVQDAPDFPLWLPGLLLVGISVDVLLGRRRE